MAVSFIDVASRAGNTILADQRRKLSQALCARLISDGVVEAYHVREVL